MIYTVEFEYSDERCLIAASDSLQACIDCVNNDRAFPNVANNVVFSVWNENRRIAEVFIDGYRHDSLCEHNKGKFTYDEVSELISKDIHRGAL